MIAELRQNVIQMLNPSAPWMSYGVYFMSIFEKDDRVIIAPHCTALMNISMADCDISCSWDQGSVNGMIEFREKRCLSPAS